MLNEETLRKLNNILSEGIHLEHGTRSAKIICHVDLDGVVSGISMVNQLVKQGIPRERITVEFAQYGDEDKDKNFSNKFVGRKGEFVGVTDFAKLPKVKIWDVYNRLWNFKGRNKKYALLKLLQKDWSNKNYEEFKKEYIKNNPDLEFNKWTEGTLKEFFTALKSYSLLGKDAPSVTFDNLEDVSYKLVNPDFVSDHHSNEQNSLSGGKRGEIAAESPSEAELFANKYAPSLWSQKDLKAVSMVDSAGYTEAQLKNTVFLEKHFSGEDRNKNLATIISCIYDNLCKKDRNAAAWVVKNSQPSLVSLYTTTLKAAGYNGKRLEYVSALKNGDVARAKELLAEIPGELNKRYDRKGDPKTPIMNLQQWRDKNTKDMANMKTGYKTREDEKKLEEFKGKRSAEAKEMRDAINSKKGKIVAHNNFSIFNGKDMKTQYTRYATTLYSKNGQRMPFSMRYWNGFFQIAKSTLYKGTVNFAEVNDHVLSDLSKFLEKEGISSFNITRIIDTMREKNGGHSGGIWSFQGFDLIKPSGKEFTEKDKAKYFTARRLVKNGSTNELAKNIIDRYDSGEGVNAKYKDIQARAMEHAMGSAIYWTNKLYPPSKENLEALKTKDKDFDEE